MHILTGMIITAILRRRAAGSGADTAALPRFRTGPIRVAHSLPGRIRFRIPSLVAAPKACAGLEKTLSGVDGVRSATANPTSGGVLVRYDPDQVRSDLLLAASARVLGLESELQRPAPPLVARELREMGRAVNRAVLEQTRGLVDLQTAAMVALGAYGLRRLAMEGTNALPAGLTLVWWAGNTLLAGRPGNAAT